MNNETQADIVAEMRRHIQAALEYPQDIEITTGDVEDWADRIETAHRREKEQTESIHLNEIIAVRKEAEDEFKQGKHAAMREALKRILDIEGYGAPWIEAKTIAQKALEGEQCTPPIAQESPKIEQPGNAAKMREALERVLDECCGLCDVPNQMTESGHTCSWRNRWSGCQSKAIDKALAALAAPPRNCDRYATPYDAVIAFAEYLRKLRGLDENYCIPIYAEVRDFANWFLGTAEGGEP